MAAQRRLTGAIGQEKLQREIVFLVKEREQAKLEKIRNMNKDSHRSNENNKEDVAEEIEGE